MSRTPTGESVLARAVRIIEAFAPGETALTVSQIAQRAELPLPTASRLIGELVQHGLLTRGPGRDVQVGIRLWELGLRASPTLILRQAALPVMKDLNTVVGHHTQLSVLDGDDVLFLERLSAPNSVINTSRVAGRMAVNATSPGIVLLAHATVERQEALLRRPFRIYTRYTIATVERLRAALADARRNGYASAPGSVHPDATGIAAPIRGARGDVTAALSVIVPSGDRASAHLPALLVAAQRIGVAIARNGGAAPGGAGR